MSPVDGLVFDRRIPPAIEQEDVAGELQVQADPPCPVADQQHVAIRIIAEPANHSSRSRLAIRP